MWCRIVFIFMTYLVLIQAKQVCYTNIGCFSNWAPFYNAFGLLPLSPEHIGTQFHLHTRQNPTNVTNLVSGMSTSALGATHFNGQHKTVFIVHGFHGEENDNWIPPMTSALLKEDDMNVIVVVWTKGAYDGYNQAVANTRVVGALIADLVKSLHNTTSLDYGSVHLIGHSLGAHICGYAGQRLHGLGRITEIAPFYSCGHIRSAYYFTESIGQNCHFTAHPCGSEDDFTHQRCKGCGKGCNNMGYHVSHSAHGTYYLTTNWHYTYCAGHH